MKTPVRLICMILLPVIFSCQSSRISYPETRKCDQTDDYFGTQVADPYRWLEDDMSEETGAWVEAQNLVTFNYLGKIPFRDKIGEKLTRMWNYPRISAPFKAGGKYFFTKNDGLQNQSVVFIMDELGNEPRVFLDPNTFSEDGTVALSDFSPSRDGKYVGYGIARSGSDWNEFFIRDIATGTDLSDHLKWIKFSGISWYGDGFYYSRYPEPEEGETMKGENLHNKIYYHKTGTPQDQDILIYEDPEHPGRGFSTSVTEDKKYLIISVTESTSGNALYFQDISRPGNPVHKMIDTFDKDFFMVYHLDGKFLIMTNYEAPNYKVIQVDVKNFQKENWTDFIPEKENQVLRGISLVGEKFFAQYEKDAHSEVEVYDTDGKYLYNIAFPAIGSVTGFSGERQDSITFYTFTSFTYPAVIYKYNIAENKSVLYHKTEIDIDLDAYETKQVFYPSKDSTLVPMFIVHKKGIMLNGKNPVWLYGYGGFNISETPFFSVTNLFWIDQGGVFALANLRGGGEYGEKWHQAGTKMNKQNVFDDFIYAAKYLIAEKYTSRSKLVIQGGSNGGLLIGAVINQAPELFRVAFPQVGVMDMLRYHKFTIGRYWATDYGTSEDSPEMFRYLYAYSPLHNIKEGVKYPAVMVTTADHDDRVVPAHSFKYAATLQEKYRGRNPVLIRIETKAGHGAGMPTAKRIQAVTDIYAFAFYNLGITPALE